MSIGKNIAKRRKALGLTQEELGVKLGVTNQAVSKWESEVSMPDVMLLPELSLALGISLEQLYGIERQAETTPIKRNEFYRLANKTLIGLLYDQIGAALLFPKVIAETNPELVEQEKNPITGKIEQIKDNKTFKLYSDQKGYAYISEDLSLIAPEFMLFNDENIFKNQAVLSAIKTLADSRICGILSFLYEEAFKDRDSYIKDRNNIVFEKEFVLENIVASCSMNEEDAYESLGRLVLLGILEKRAKTYALYKPKFIQLIIFLETLNRLIHETNLYAWGWDDSDTLVCNNIDEYLP